MLLRLIVESEMVIIRINDSIEISPLDNGRSVGNPPMANDITSAVSIINEELPRKLMILMHLCKGNRLLYLSDQQYRMMT